MRTLPWHLVRFTIEPLASGALYGPREDLSNSRLTMPAAMGPRLSRLREPSIVSTHSHR